MSIKMFYVSRLDFQNITAPCGAVGSFEQERKPLNTCILYYLFTMQPKYELKPKKYF